jgi:transposase
MDKCPRCIELEKRIVELEARIELLESRLRDILGDDEGPGPPGNPGYLDKVKKKKPKKQYGKNKKKKKRGARRGHQGHGRQKCEVIDREVDLVLQRCPGCGGELLEYKKPSQHVKEDLEIRKVATKYNVHRYHCPCCCKEVRPDFEPGFIGDTAKSLSTLLHYYSGVPFGKVREMFGWFGLQVSEGSLARWGKAFFGKFRDLYDELKGRLRRSPYVGVDETGWPVDGNNRWLWVFRSPESVVYTIDESRGSKVVNEVLGENFNGVLGSDFYSAYNPPATRKQKCLVHLLRHIRGWGESKNFEKRSLHYGLHRTVEKATGLAQKKGKFPADAYEKKVDGFKSDFDEFLQFYPSDPDCARLMRLLVKHRDELWTFLTSDVPHHNNDVEMAIRRAVVNRKVSCGNRSDIGASVQEVLLSVIQTAKMHGRNLMKTLLQPPNLLPIPT